MNLWQCGRVVIDGEKLPAGYTLCVYFITLLGRDPAGPLFRFVALCDADYMLELLKEELIKAACNDHGDTESAVTRAWKRFGSGSRVYEGNKTVVEYP